MNDYDILKLFDEKSPVYLTDISPEYAYDVLTLLRRLRKEGYVSCAPSSNGPYSLTTSGRAYFLKLQDEEGHRKAEQARDEDVNNAQSVVNSRQNLRNGLLIAAFTVLLTLLLERLPAIIQFFK